MGLAKNDCTGSVEPLQKKFPSKKQTAFSNAVYEFYVNSENDYYEVKFKSFLHKMIRDFGLNCFKPHRRRSSGKNQGTDDNCGGPGSHLEHNKAWLLAESVGCGAEEPHSVPSFRFNFCSQIELESVNVNSCFSSAVVLMVNLDNGSSSDSNSKELKRRGIESLERSISPVAHSLIKFSYAEILSATRNFSKGRVLGREALSCVFRGRVGFLSTAVAIKRLDKEDKESPKAFCRELMIASSLHNQYIVPLVGYCTDPEEGLFLVYKYVSGGSLERFLHGKKTGGKAGRAPPWWARHKIAVGVAEAIGYLHSGTERCVVHRDIKPSNILLSSKKAPKLHDFGLATWTPLPSVPFLCKTVKGTFGYLAPEYFLHGKVSDKTDVYAFGVVLLELISGQKPIEAKRGPGEENLVSWAKPLLQQGAVEKLLDPRLRFTTKNSNQIAQMVQAAAACLQSKESRRPEMGEIIAILKGREYNCLINKKVMPGNSSVIDCYPQFEQTRSEMKTHLASAVLGIKFDDEDQLYSW